MERLQARLTAAVAVAALAVGCTLDAEFTTAKLSDKPPPPSAEICQVVAAWSNKVTYTPDPARQGVPAPGIAGRIYMFGQELGHTQTGDGDLVIDLYDDTPRGGQPSSVQLEQWRFDRATLKRLIRRDMVGWGYTIFLPWGSYRPDVSKVHLAVRYEPAKGVPLYAPGSPLTLEHVPPPTGVVPGPVR